MRTSQAFTRMFLALAALFLMSTAALAADPGLAFPISAEASDQKAGSILFYNTYTSGATSGNAQNTRINITNTSSASGIYVHLFFVADTCQIADSYICLTPNQTASFLASDVDPGVSGYIVAIAVNSDGLPINFNYLAGDEYVKFSTGHAANLGAVAYSKINADNVISTDGSLAAVFFDGLNLAGSYNRAPRVVAIDNVPSRADGNDTLVILNRVGGNLATGAATLSSIFGLMYDDSESVFSFSVVGGCQLRGSLSNTFPRTTPRFETVIPAGRSGWAKMWTAADSAISGAVINTNPNAAASAGAFNGGHNLHTLTLSAAANFVIPVFPPSC
ncbi:MAG: hypothetical protein SF339_18625 [Blastocatellia bacterium]|nr:hypothetical protein [Blastocatellia bacterium]